MFVVIRQAENLRCPITPSNFLVEVSIFSYFRNNMLPKKASFHLRLKTSKLCNHNNQGQRILEPKTVVIRQGIRYYHEEHAPSCLFVSRSRAAQTFAAINPKIDFGTLFQCEKKMSELKDNMMARKLSTDHLNELVVGWTRYQQLLQEKILLAKKITDLRQNLKGLDRESNTCVDISKSLRACQAQASKITSEISNLEDTIVVSAMHLPNKLLGVSLNSSVMVRHGEKPKFDFMEECHMKFGKRLKTIHVKNVGKSSVYLRGTGAILEQAALSYFSQKLCELGMQRISGSHICKTVMVEGVHVVDAMNPNQRIVLEDMKKNLDLNKLQLVGGSSLESLSALLTKCMFDHSNLPIRLFSCGRHYKMTEASDLNLFTSPQSSSIHYVVATREDDVDKRFEEMRKFFEGIYKQINIPFIIQGVPASDLSLAESSRASIQLWSPSQNRYLECASISTYGDFISQRLIMRYRSQHGKNFLHLLSGCVVNFNILYATLLENNQDESRTFKIPEVFLPYLNEAVVQR